MNDNLTKLQTGAILKALDEALEKGPWEESNFLRVIGKNLRIIRDDLAEEIARTSALITEDENKDTMSPRIQSGQREVYIALYSAEGTHLISWERIIANLQRQIISRPIYTNEEDVKFLIKSKENKVNEAYVVIYINESDILTMSADKTPVDKFGKSLLSIKDRSINLENINRFVHFSDTYHYVKGRLVKQEETE